MSKLHTIAQHAAFMLVVTALCLSLASEALHAQDARQAPVEEEAVVSDEQAALAGAIAEANNAFAWSLYAKLTEGESDNVFFSPASIHTALSMTMLGARGDTESQMYDVLAMPVGGWQEDLADPFPIGDRQDVHPIYCDLLAMLAPEEHEEDEEGPGYELHIANALWGQDGYPWEQDFLVSAEHYYYAGLEEVNFQTDTEAARQTINTWVEQQTNDKIVDLIPAGMLDSLTRLVLVNAIYFKGDWAEPFDAEDTADRPFHISPDEMVDTPMMHTTEGFGYAETEDVQVLQLPYEGDELSMIVILPKDADGLADVEALLAADGLGGVVGALRTQEVDVMLPKFTMTSQFSLGDMLQAMGMTDAFSSAAADFTGLSEQATDDGLHISAVIHQAFVDVNEEGTEAAAATAVGIQAMSMPAPPIEFTADHPFVFVIRHEATGVILFMGRVMDPGQDDESQSNTAE